jgi:hypothetical protein
MIVTVAISATRAALRLARRLRRRESRHEIASRRASADRAAGVHAVGASARCRRRAGRRAAEAGRGGAAGGVRRVDFRRLRGRVPTRGVRARHGGGARRCSVACLATCTRAATATRPRRGCLGRCRNPRPVRCGPPSACTTSICYRCSAPSAWHMVPHAWRERWSSTTRTTEGAVRRGTGLGAACVTSQGSRRQTSTQYGRCWPWPRSAGTGAGTLTRAPLGVSLSASRTVRAHQRCVTRALRRNVAKLCSQARGAARGCERRPLLPGRKEQSGDRSPNARFQGKAR